MAKGRGWTCQRVAGGVPCKHHNPSIKRNCELCGKRRPPRKTPAHLAAKDVPYEECVERFGERCGICGAPPKNQRLHRDHDHSGTGRLRGLLCFRCNTALRSYMTVEWLRAAADYLERP